MYYLKIFQDIFIYFEKVCIFCNYFNEKQIYNLMTDKYSGKYNVFSKTNQAYVFMWGGGGEKIIQLPK